MCYMTYLKYFLLKSIVSLSQYKFFSFIHFFLFFFKSRSQKRTKQFHIKGCLLRLLSLIWTRGSWIFTYIRRHIFLIVVQDLSLFLPDELLLFVVNLKGTLHSYKCQPTNNCTMQIILNWLKENTADNWGNCGQ